MPSPPVSYPDIKEPKSRGCGSNYHVPAYAAGLKAIEKLEEAVHHANCKGGGRRRLSEIRYRTASSNSDITHHVFRWDTRNYKEVFRNGFQLNPETQDLASCYNLNEYVNVADSPLDNSRPKRHAFISTIVDSNWRPIPDVNVLPGGGEMLVYRYEIYAPGGIWVAATLRDHYIYDSQDEVCFVGGIKTTYIRSAQLWRIFRPPYQSGTQPPFPIHRRVDSTLKMNANFNPTNFWHIKMITIQKPIHYYVDEKDGSLKMLHQEMDFPPTKDKLKEAANKWYLSDVIDESSYIDAAFQSSTTNEAYIFMKNEYVILNYAPHSTGDYIVNGPILICEGFPSLIATPFGEYGIDCAFNTNNNKAFIFCTNICAYIDYPQGITHDKIRKGPMTISSMFPFFKGKVFENGIDAAFRSTISQEVYLFRGDQYALINYKSMTLIHIQKIADGFPCLIGTIFAINGIDAAFASHSPNEAYIFKGEYYALINFIPHTTNAYMIDGQVKLILPNWQSLATILPRKNAGVDGQSHCNIYVS